MRTFLRLVVLGATVAAAVLTGAAASSASTTPNMPACSTASGNLIDSYTVPNAPAALYLYYDAARGTNCAKLQHLSSSYGAARQTMVELWTCTTSTAGAECFLVSSSAPYYGHDDGNYAYYAGPVSVRAANRCIYARGYMDWNGSRHWVSSGNRADGSAKATHCG